MLHCYRTTNKFCSIKNFFFPIFNPFFSIKPIVFIAVFLAMSILLSSFSIKIPIFNSVISFSWIAIMLLGWHFGPIYGLIFGFIFDCINFLFIKSSIWFWMYAIQKPIVGFISGIFGSIYQIKVKNINQKGIIFDIAISQIIIFLFFGFCLIILKFFDNIPLSFKKKISTIYDWFKYIFVSITLFIFESMLIFIIIKEKKKNNFLRILVLCYTSCLVLILMLLFSFILGPITTIKYLTFLGQNPKSSIFYLIPRIFIQAIKCPIEIYILWIIIPISSDKFERIINQINNKWK